MTCLTLLEINPSNQRARKDMRNLYEMHRTMMSVFPQASSDSPREEFGVLWRTEVSDKVQLLLQSAVAPDLARLYEGNYIKQAQTKSTDAFLDSISDGENLRYAATMNPTTIKSSAGGRHRKRLVVPLRDCNAWWSDRLTTVGAEALDASHCRSMQDMHCPGGNKVMYPVAQIRTEGFLKVTNAERLRAALRSGIGRGKSFGCGLLTVARI